jgi:hypothetical protein
MLGIDLNAVQNGLMKNFGSASAIVTNLITFFIVGLVYSKIISKNVDYAFLAVFPDARLDYYNQLIFGEKKSLSHYRNNNVMDTGKVLMRRSIDDRPGVNSPNQFAEDKELNYTNPKRKTIKSNEHYVNTRGIINNLAVTDKTDTLYHSPNKYESDLKDKDLEKSLHGR